MENLYDIIKLPKEEGKAMYVGTYRLTLDERDRMRIPSKLRAKYPSDADLYLMQGTDCCLFLVTANEMEHILSAVEELPLSDTDMQNALRAILGSVSLIEEDSQGRFVLQSYLKEAADINKKLVFIGMRNRVEIWAEEVYEANRFGAKGETTKALGILKAKGYEI